MKRALAVLVTAWSCGAWATDDLSAVGPAKADFPKPYSPPCVERENVFEFTEKPKVKNLGNDKYEITFAVKANCDVTMGIVDSEGKVVRHLGAGVLGPNAPLPFQKNSLKQTIYWNGKDDLDEYHKTPDKLRVRVMLGLKPVFDKRLGGTSPHNLVGNPLAFAAAPDGMYVFTRGPEQFLLRKFDHDGKYMRSLIPPPADMPEERLKGMGYVEYEPGKRAVHCPTVWYSVSSRGHFLPGMNEQTVLNPRVALVKDRIYYLNGGSWMQGSPRPSLLYYIGTDGSTDESGMAGQPFLPGASHMYPRLAASPDGKWLYAVGVGVYGGGSHTVVRIPLDGSGTAKPFIGQGVDKDKGNTRGGSPGNVPGAFNNPLDIGCDAAGRIYVADECNNRVQIFSPEGKYLKEIPVDRPHLLCVNKKTGALYVQHMTTVQGRSVARLTKFTSFDEPKEECTLDNVHSGIMEVDPGTPTPRVWLASDTFSAMGVSTVQHFGAKRPSVSVWEEDGKNFKKVLDFEEQARKDDGEAYIDRWSGNFNDKVICDNVRGRVYLRNSMVIDFQTGRALHTVRIPAPVDDLAVDKRGYIHCHFDPTDNCFPSGVGRLDPSQSEPYRNIGGVQKGIAVYREVPYDYGMELESRGKPTGWMGVLPTRGQHKFQNGLGVNMMGDIAVVSSIYYTPKMEEEMFTSAFGGQLGRMDAEARNYLRNNRYPEYLRSIQERQKRGEEIYYIRRLPGIPLTAETIWTFDRNGELREECAVTAPFVMGGVQMDEDGFLYFAQCGTKMVNGKAFLDGRAGNIGCAKPFPAPMPGAPDSARAWTGTYMKAKPKDVRFLLKNAPVPLDEDQTPKRPPDLCRAGMNVGEPAWVEGAEWLYAGASPIQVAASQCICPSMRPHLDWYKRSFVPEAYRHSFGVLDTNGNLLMHLGRYGNFDDAGRMKPGGEDIAVTLPRFISGTDDYLVFDDWGERMVMLKLNYHAEETAGIQ